MEHMKRHEISEKQWNRLKEKFPPEKKPQGGQAWKKQPGNAQRDSVLAEHRNTMAGSAGAVRAMAERIQQVSGMDKSWSMGKYPHSPD